MPPGQAASSMSSKEYAPGQRVQSPEPFWKGGHDPTFSLTNFPSTPAAAYATTTTTTTNATTAVAATSPPSKPIPVPPPKRLSTSHYVQSPPAPESPGQSQVTDESDDSLVHINPPPRHVQESRERDPPVSTIRRSDSLSLTRANLHQHNNVLGGTGSNTNGMLTPLRGDYTSSGLNSTRKRLRAKELSTHTKDTLIQMLVKQETSTDESRKLLRNALDKLEQYKLDMVESNNHCRRLERHCQKLTDERMLMHTQLAESLAKAQQQTLASQQELSINRLRLEHTEQALAAAQVDLRETRLQRDTAKAEAERFRNEAHRLREESNVRTAREQGRKEGFDQGVQQGRVVGAAQSGGGGTPRQITQAGETATAETSIVGNGEGNEEANTSNTTNRNSSSRTDKRHSTSVSSSSRDHHLRRLEFEEALERARKDTEDRLQRDLESRLNEERHRLEILNLQQTQAREMEFQHERERLRKSFEETEASRSAQIRKDTELMERRIKEEKDNLKKVLQKEKDKERMERERARVERERERREARERLDAERRRLEVERERERERQIERDRERDRVVEEATKRAVEAVAAANASRAASDASASAASGSDHELQQQQQPQQRTFPVPPLPYIPMPRPPMDMPVPSIPTNPTMSMPEPTSSIINNPLVNTRPHTRSSTHPQPGLPTTVRPSRNRRYSVDSQSSLSTVAADSSLLSFPYSVPVPPGGRTSSASGSNRPVGVVLPPGVPGSTGSNGTAPGRSSSRNGGGGGGGNGGGPYTRPYISSTSTTTPSGSGGIYGIPGSNTREGGLDGIPEDEDSYRSSPALVIPPLPILNMPGTTPSTASSSGRTGGNTRREQQQHPPSWYPDAGGRGSGNGGASGSGRGNPPPVVPTIRVDEGGDGPGWRDGESYENQQPMNAALLNPRFGKTIGGNLRRSDSANSARPSIRSNSSYEINIEPPSNPTSPRGISNNEPPSPHEHHHQHSQNQNPNQYLSPLHATVPIPPPQPPLPVRIHSSTSASEGRQRTRTSSSARSGEREDETRTEPNSPVMPSSNLPPGFIPQTFTPNRAASPSLPPVSAELSGLPPGFVPHAITDSVTGATTPLTGVSALPSVGGGGGGGGASTSRRQSFYGNPAGDSNEGVATNADGAWGGSVWGDSTKPGGGGSSPYRSSSPLPVGPPVIPRGSTFDSEDAGGGTGSGWPTPSQRARNIYGGGPGGTPAAAGSTRNLPGNGTPAGGGVYQNPLRQQDDGDYNDGDGDGDDFVARNTKINATAPLPQRKKKKKAGK